MRTAVRKDKPLHAPAPLLHRSGGGFRGKGKPRYRGGGGGSRDAERRSGEQKGDGTRAKGTGAKH
jgi:hypothetical protein